MIDAPGPWGTGPFQLVEGYSSLENEQAITHRDPLACIWLQTREDRTSTVRLRANPDYWDTSRGPHLEEVVFRNDVRPERALDLVCDTEGEVDLVTSVPPVAAARVQSSRFAQLVTIEAVRSLAGVINRYAAGMPLHETRARMALNYAVDRERLIRDAFFGYADELAGLTPSAAVTAVHRLAPYRWAPREAAEAWRIVTGPEPMRALRIAAPEEFQTVARCLAEDFSRALDLESEVWLLRGDEKRHARRSLAEGRTPPEWDILLMEVGPQTADAPPIELHRAFVGATGELRAGPVLPEFEDLYSELMRQTTNVGLSRLSYEIDQYVHHEALALFLCAPHALYAVNKQVDFTPYRTTFELAETKVSAEHWSRRATDAPPEPLAE